jgi:hypothetical protein
MEGRNTMQDNEDRADDWVSGNPDGVLFRLEVRRQDVTAEALPEGVPTDAIALGAAVSQRLHCETNGDLLLVLRSVQSAEGVLRDKIAGAMSMQLTEDLAEVLASVGGAKAASLASLLGLIDDPRLTEAALDAFDPDDWTPGTDDRGHVTATHDRCGQTFAVVEAMVGSHAADCEGARIAQDVSK